MYENIDMDEKSEMGYACVCPECNKYYGHEDAQKGNDVSTSNNYPMFLLCCRCGVEFSTK